MTLAWKITYNFFNCFAKIIKNYFVMPVNSRILLPLSGRSHVGVLSFGAAGSCIATPSMSVSDFEKGRLLGVVREWYPQRRNWCIVSCSLDDENPRPRNASETMHTCFSRLCGAILKLTCSWSDRQSGARWPSSHGELPEAARRFCFQTIHVMPNKFDRP